MKDNNFETIGDKIVLKRAVFFSCGCGSIISALAAVLRFLPITSRQLPQVRAKSNLLARKYFKQENLYDKIPKLNDKVYGILIHPDGRWVDIRSASALAVSKKFKEILELEDVSKPN